MYKKKKRKLFGLREMQMRYTGNLFIQMRARTRK